MKRLLLFSLIALIATGAYAQGFMRSRFNLEGNYTRTERFNPYAAFAFDCRFESGNGCNIGYQAGPSQHSFNLAYQIGTKGFTHDDFCYIENRYLYRIFTDYHLQEFNAMLTLGYRNAHWNFQLGLCNRYIAEIPLRKNGGEGVIFEPMNVVFKVEGNLFDQNHPWNIGAGVSNYREFIIERFTLFYYNIHGYYDLTTQWRLVGEVGLHPAGVLNLSSQFNGFFINLGVTYNH